MDNQYARGADPVRRAVLAMGAVSPLLAAAGTARAEDGPPAWAIEGTPAGKLGDFDFLVGRWRVRHHRLVGRLVGSTTWQDFGGESVLQLMMDGHATVDDNIIEIPSGTYRAVALRVLGAQSRRWAVYWFDGRSSKIDPPVFGGFDGRHGIFLGEDVLNGRPIRVRFQWFIDAPDRLRWEQAFSPDAGATWETNWRMALERV